MKSVWVLLLVSLAGRPLFADDNHRLVRPPITIVDQNGKVAPVSPPSPTGATVDVDVAPNFSLSFSPSTVNITAGDTVRWTWRASGHNVRAGTPCNTPSGTFCSPSDTSCTTNPTSSTGTVYSHTFNAAGSFSYYCSVHCGSGMTGTVNVTAAPPSITVISITRDSNGQVTITGQTSPNVTLHVQSSPDLVTSFGNPVAVTANGTGGFTFNETPGIAGKYYRVVYP